MLSWLKFTLMSFFSNKTSKEGANRSFWNVVFALTTCIIIMTSFIATGFNYSFTTHYSKASEFKEFAYNIFANEVVEERINVIVNDDSLREEKVLKATYNDGSYVVIDTFNYDTDSKFIKYDYNLVIDTRPSNKTFSKVDAYYQSNTDENKKISGENYSSLSDDEKANYTLKLDLKRETIDPSNFSYIDNGSEIFKTTAEAYSYIETYTATLKEDNDLVKEFKKVKEIETTKPEYAESVYSLYMRCYYKTLIATPTILDYYQKQYASIIASEENIKNFIFITDTWASFSFTNDNNLVFTFDGFYDEVEDGFTFYNLQNRNDLDQIKLNIDLLITSVYSTRFSYQTLVSGMNVMTFMPYILFAIAVFGLLIFCICKLKRRAYGDRFIGSFKIVSSYLIMSSALAGIVGMILFFILDSTAAFGITCWGLLSIIGFRTIILIIGEEIAYKKNPLRDQVVYKKKVVSSNEVIDAYEDNLNLANTSFDNGTKVITNDVDDEDEKMEFM